MSKSLKSMFPDERAKAIDRRIKSNTCGLGYWSAVEAKKKG